MTFQLLWLLAGQFFGAVNMNGKVKAMLEKLNKLCNYVMISDYVIIYDYVMIAPVYLYNFYHLCYVYSTTVFPNFGRLKTNICNIVTASQEGPVVSLLCCACLDRACLHFRSSFQNSNLKACVAGVRIPCPSPQKGNNFKDVIMWSIPSIPTQKTLKISENRSAWHHVGVICYNPSNQG